MNPVIALLLHRLGLSRRLMHGSVRDLSAAELSRRPYPADRSCARLLGMAAVADREVLRLLDVVELPEVPAGFEMRFAWWGTGEDEAREYDPSLPAIFGSHRDALVRAIGPLEPDSLDEFVDPPGQLDEEAMFRFRTIGEMILATSAYTSFLVGEVAGVRLALGKAPIVDPVDGSIAAFRGLLPGVAGGRVAWGDR